MAVCTSMYQVHTFLYFAGAWPSMSVYFKFLILTCLLASDSGTCPHIEPYHRFIPCCLAAPLPVPARLGTGAGCLLGNSAAFSASKGINGRWWGVQGNHVSHDTVHHILVFQGSTAGYWPAVAMLCACISISSFFHSFHANMPNLMIDWNGICMTYTVMVTMHIFECLLDIP